MITDFWLPPWSHLHFNLFVKINCFMNLGICNIFGGEDWSKGDNYFQSSLQSFPLFFVLLMNAGVLHTLFLFYISNVFTEHFLASLVISSAGLELGLFVFNLYFGKDLKRSRVRIKGEIQWETELKSKRRAGKEQSWNILLNKITPL